MEDIMIAMGDIFYSTINPRRRYEVADSRMIQEDHKAMANLPQEGFQREFKSNAMCRAKKKSYFNDEIG